VETAHGTLVHLEERRLATRHGEFRAHLFHDCGAGRLAVALLRGDVRGPEPLLARVHSSCTTSEIYGACDCDCAEQLDAALRAIAREGRGALFYLMQEGRGAGFGAKARDRMWVQASRQRLTTFEAYERMGLGGDQRRYEPVAFARRLLEIGAPLRLLTNNPDKLAAVEAAKVPVVGALPLRRRPQPFNSHYLDSKSRSGHDLGRAGDGRAAELPEEVVAFEPHALPGLPRLVRLASYLLPIRLPGGPPCWFRLHLYLDRAAQAERVVLTHGPSAHPQPLRCVQREPLFERFALPARAAAERRRWRAAARAMVRRGAGCAVFLPLEPGPSEAPARGPARPDEVAALLLAHHRGGEAAAG